MTLTRRAFVGSCALGALGTHWGCSRQREQRVTLYSSVDDHVLREVVAAYEQAAGARVLVVADTEATKTTGLVQRLIAEKARPRADVWWSSEPFGTIRLARESILAPGAPAPPLHPASSRLAGSLSAPDASWHAMSLRARVLAARRGAFDGAPPPTRLRDLARAGLRVGMARAQFGTTRGHMTLLASLAGVETLERWLVAMRDAGLRLYNGNSSVVRAVAEGEIDIGLTDTDDVWAARRNNWPVDPFFESPDTPETPPGENELPSPGPMLIPCTVAIVAGGPAGTDAARDLASFLLSPRCERILAFSDSHNVPVRDLMPAELGAFAIPGGYMPDLLRASGFEDPAMAAWLRVFGG